VGSELFIRARQMIARAGSSMLDPYNAVSDKTKHWPGLATSIRRTLAHQ
jgi:hypothetical protein